MKRMKVLIGKRRVMVIATLAILVLAAAALIASSASFTAQSANAGNVFSSGTLAMTNTPTGMGVTVNNWVPGDSKTGSVIIKNTGSVSGHFYLNAVKLTGETKSFGSELQLLITDPTATPTTVYSGTLAGLGKTSLGIWAANDTHTYTIKVSFPNTGVGAEDAYQGATVAAEFDWSAEAANPMP